MQYMKDRKQFWKGLAAGFVITLALVEAAVFGRDVLTDMEAAKKAESDWLAFLGENASATVSVKGNLAVIGTADAVRLIDDYKDGLLG